jgi:hypothetical protein
MRITAIAAGGAPDERAKMVGRGSVIWPLNRIMTGR